MRANIWKRFSVGGERQTLRHVHIDTPLGIVNVRTGLVDAEGRAVVNIEIIPDDQPGPLKVSSTGPAYIRLIQTGE